MAVDTGLVDKRASGDEIFERFTGTGDVQGFFETMVKSLEGLKADIKSGDLTIS